jgi:tryptophan 2,3-dioxygenase
MEENPWPAKMIAPKSTLTTKWLRTTQVIGSMTDHDILQMREKLTQALGVSSFTGLSFFMK